MTIQSTILAALCPNIPPHIVVTRRVAHSQGENTERCIPADKEPLVYNTLHKALSHTGGVATIVVEATGNSGRTGRGFLVLFRRGGGSRRS